MPSPPRVDAVASGAYGPVRQPGWMDRIVGPLGDQQTGLTSPLAHRTYAKWEEGKCASPPNTSELGVSLYAA